MSRPWKFAASSEDLWSSRGYGRIGSLPKEYVALAFSRNIQMLSEHIQREGWWRQFNFVDVAKEKALLC